MSSRAAQTARDLTLAIRASTRAEGVHSNCEVPPRAAPARDDKESARNGRISNGAAAPAKRKRANKPRAVREFVTAQALFPNDNSERLR